MSTHSRQIGMTKWQKKFDNHMTELLSLLENLDPDALDLEAMIKINAEWKWFKRRFRKSDPVFARTSFHEFPYGDCRRQEHKRKGNCVICRDPGETL